MHVEALGIREDLFVEQEQLAERVRSVGLLALGAVELQLLGRVALDVLDVLVGLLETLLGGQLLSDELIDRAAEIPYA